ncbi:MAG: ComF family protein [Chitinophagia bacterium]|nr:ComF family protein [Chitinophagia bacterium]
MYPQICFGCGTDQVEKAMPLCHKCIQDLPFTDFFSINENPVEKIFWGRADIQNAGALLFFTKDSLVQTLITALKYHHNKKVGILFGKLMGEAIAVEEKFKQIDLIIPIPISASKINSRGFNQSEVIAIGIQQIWHRPILNNVLIKRSWSNSQTKKNRKARLQQLPDLFYLQKPTSIEGKHILLVDDVLTSGATLEAAVASLMTGSPASVSIAVAAYTL